MSVYRHQLRVRDLRAPEERDRSNGSTVREASRQASATAVSSERVEESPRAKFFLAAHPELSRMTRLRYLVSVKNPCQTLLISQGGNGGVLQ